MFRMAEVTIEVNQRSYKVACDDGQEDHLVRLGGYIDSRAKELAASVGPIGDARLLVMVALLISDELSETYAELDVVSSADNGASAALLADNQLSSKLENLTERIEKMTKSIP